MHAARTDHIQNNPSKQMESSTSKYPKLTGLQLPELKFPNFPDYEVIECPDFNTSDESENEHEEETKTSTSVIDRLRDENGSLDLGIHKSNFGVLNETNVNTTKTRKLVNYDSTQITKEHVTENYVSKKEYTIPFKFGDRGSRWRLIKFDKLGDSPTESEIFEQYATLWDYKLAKLEKEEMTSRRNKRESEWAYEPTVEFMKERNAHVFANKLAMKNVKKRSEIEVRDEAGDDTGRVIEMKKYGELKVSRNKRMKNELKLAHLTAMDSEFEDFTISRETIESLNND